MRIEISRLHKRLGRTMIYAAHDQSEAMLADKIVVLTLVSGAGWGTADSITIRQTVLPDYRFAMNPASKSDFHHRS